MKNVKRLDNMTSQKPQPPTNQCLVMECSKCSYSCSTKQDMLTHFKDEHVVDRSKPKLVSCQHCSFKGDCERRVEFHQLFCDQHRSRRTETTDQASSYQCDLCDFQTPFGGKLRCHVDNKHNEEVAEQSDAASGTEEKVGTEQEPEGNVTIENVTGRGESEQDGHAEAEAHVEQPEISPDSNRDEEMDCSETSVTDSDEDGQTTADNIPAEKGPVIKSYQCKKCSTPFESLIGLSVHAVKCPSTPEPEQKMAEKTPPENDQKPTQAKSLKLKTEADDGAQPQTLPRASCSKCNQQFIKVIELAKHFVSCQ